MTYTLSGPLSFTNVKSQSGSLCPEFIANLKSAFNLDAFVETGTYLGDSAIAASKSFKQVHTIELSLNLYRNAIEKFKDYPKIHCHLGDSEEVMLKLVPSLSGRVLFWLDGHYSGGITSRGNSNTPILNELEAICFLASNESVILIDDLRLFQHPKPGFQAASSLDGYPTITALKQDIQKIFPNNQFIVYGDIAIVLTGGLSCSISPLLEGMTTSRLWNGDLGPSYELTKAERGIISAQGDELHALNDLYLMRKSDLDYGLSGHYHLWYILTLIGKKDLASARDELRKLMDSGIINNQRLEWYNLLLTSQPDVTATEKGTVPFSYPEAELLQRLLTSDKGVERVGPTAATIPIALSRATDLLSQLRRAEVWSDGLPLRIHLGCGEQYFEGYVNIDYPPSSHNVMATKADFHANITDLDFPEGSVDEIRLHHVFEHFNRTTALGLLIRWQKWLKIGGKIHIETPDLQGSAQTMVSDATLKVKMAAARHLAGDQAASWGYHVDHWFPERFQHTLNKLGFEHVETTSISWPDDPFLSNVQAIGLKTKNISTKKLLQAADELLWESTVADSEQSTFEIWQAQLREFLEDSHVPEKITQSNPAVIKDSTVQDTLSHAGSNLPLDEIHDFNQRCRNHWVAEKITTIPHGSLVLDVGAGTCPYRSLFAHCDYKSHDFKKYSGPKLGGATEYGEIDYVSEITNIPAPDSSFDVLLCTEVLEHVADPFHAIKEMARLLKPGGRLLVTAPLGSGLHQLPFHFYGGFTPEWYKLAAKRAGLAIIEITPNGGFFKLLAQECARVAWTFDQHRHLYGSNTEQIYELFKESLPRYLFQLDDQCFIDQFTVGYHVEMSKTIQFDEKIRLLDRLVNNPHDTETLFRLASLELEHSNNATARRYLIAALAIEPRNEKARALWDKIQ